MDPYLGAGVRVLGIGERDRGLCVCDDDGVERVLGSLIGVMGCRPERMRLVAGRDVEGMLDVAGGFVLWLRERIRS